MPGGARESELVALLGNVAAKIRTGDDLESAARAALEMVCEATGWRVGHLYVWDEADGRFVPSDVWAGAVEEFADLREVTATTRFAPGTGIIGHAAKTGRPVWLHDVTCDPVFLRARQGVDLGVGAALAFPVTAADGVVAVLEFFSHEVIPQDAQLMRVTASLGHHLGLVADRWRARQEVEAARTRLEQIIGTSVEAFVSIDADGHIIDWNTAAERMFGLTREQALGRVMHETIVPARYRGADEAGRVRFLATGRSQVLGRRLELAALRADGSEFPVELVMWATREGDARTFNAFIHDITDRRRAEHALREAYEHEQTTVARLKELDRAKDDFVAAVSHELRTPLTVIIGYLEILGDDDLPLGQRDRMLSTMTHNAMRLRKLIEDLLAVNTVTGGSLAVDPVPLAVAEVLDEALRETAAEIQCAGHRVRVHVDPAVPRIRADRGLLVGAVGALLSNAAKYSANDTPITVRASVADTDVSIAVIDHGAGIAEDELPRVFDRFARARSTRDEAIQGVGLGLTIAKAVAEAHGGTITATSTPGEGSVFTLVLPASGPGPEAGPGEPADDRRAAAGESGRGLPPGPSGS
ncbi:PAS domain S-box protein [Planomonospora sp. ID67723]|uniref:sensor histidine kinase n=1 Tax=Planomonospora sp. ID67723 TaxID=2738134 RepID=UPI0018C43EB8|nr:ATP-binding protein [Planomonospora sp. ID67723]MBG0832175.1 PAS domain S-box protein [Planomonospora sp. ID67723]